MREHILIIGAVANVVVDKQIRVQPMKNFGESAGVFGVVFYKVAVLSFSWGIAAEAVFLGSVLVGAGGVVSVLRAASVMNGACGNDCVFGGRDLIFGKFAKKPHCGNNAVGLAGMDS